MGLRTALQQLHRSILRERSHCSKKTVHRNATLSRVHRHAPLFFYEEEAEPAGDAPAVAAAGDDADEEDAVEKCFELIEAEAAGAALLEMRRFKEMMGALGVGLD